jgi:hypothetical protein
MLPGIRGVVILSNMAAQPLFNRRIQLRTAVFVELVAWALPQPVSGCLHPYKYRLALVVEGECVLRYDSEAGKGDHRHRGGRESTYPFTEIDRLVADFLTDVSRWLHDHDNL